MHPPFSKLRPVSWYWRRASASAANVRRTSTRNHFAAALSHTIEPTMGDVDTPIRRRTNGWSPPITSSLGTHRVAQQNCLQS